MIEPTMKAAKTGPTVPLIADVSSQPDKMPAFFARADGRQALSRSVIANRAHASSDGLIWPKDG